VPPTPPRRGGPRSTRLRSPLVPVRPGHDNRKQVFAKTCLRSYRDPVDLTTITPEPAALRALSHPLRLRLLGLLRSDGPATATALAQRLGLTSGATSYHLRQLHQHGFVTDDAERGNGRDRWWRAAHQSTRTDRTNEATPEGREATDAFEQAIAVVHTEALQRAIEEAPTRPAAWRRVLTTSDWHLRLTPARAEQLMRTLDDLVSGWAEDDEDADGAAELVVQLHTFPRPGTMGPDVAALPDPT
jgi:predicted ArsR family transcriptional regulator